MSRFRVGDVVEIIGTVHTEPAAHRFIGMQGVVIYLGQWPNPHKDGCTEYARLSPESVNGLSEIGWYVSALRKINPPDWSAPLTTELESPLKGEVGA